jgi:hypothetical protein
MSVSLRKWEVVERTLSEMYVTSFSEYNVVLVVLRGHGSPFFSVLILGNV